MSPSGNGFRSATSLVTTSRPSATNEPGAVFAYCLDPRLVFAGDPKHVLDAEVVPGGVGTTAHLSMKFGVLDEADRIEYVEVVPDRRIVMAMQPTMSRGKFHHDTTLHADPRVRAGR